MLDLGYSGDISNYITRIGNAIAFNGKKKGNLEYLNLTSCINGESNIKKLYNGMSIS